MDFVKKLSRRVHSETTAKFGGLDARFFLRAWTRET